MKKTFHLAALLLLIPMVLCSCTASQPDDAPASASPALLLGFSQLGAESAWRLGNTRSIQEAAEKAGVALMYLDANQKQEEQIKHIRSFIAYQVDVIAFSPKVETGWDNVLREAKEAGIPVLLTDRMIRTEDESLYAGFIGSDFFQEGVSAGEFLLQKMKGQTDVRIVELSGTIDSTPMCQRGEGFRAALKGHPELQIIQSVSGDFLRTKGRECMKELLETCERIDVLYAHNDAMALGAITAIEEAGLQPGKDIVIISVDGEQAAIDALRKGQINCVVECTPMIGDTIMELSKRLAAGKEIPRVTHPQERVFSEFDSDLDSLLPRGY